MNDDGKRYDIVKTELVLTGQQIDKFDGLSTTTKTWMITVWAALSGWGLQSDMRYNFLFACLTTLFFWFLDGYNKAFRQDYRNRREEIGAALRQFAESGSFPAGFRSPDFPPHPVSSIAKGLLRPHVALPYLAIIILSLLLYFVT